MPEVSLSLPLNGKEVIEAVVDRLREVLQRDCFLSPNMAYDAFSARIDIEISARDAGRVVKVERSLVNEAGEGDLDESDSLTVEIDEAPPNEVRVGTGQEVPVLTTENGRRVIKGVRYARKRVAQ